jgi:hypothetical protein
MIGNWQQERIRLNHDWLKNELIQHIRAFIQRLSADAPNASRLAEFAAEDWAKWKSNRTDIRALIASAEDALSPRQLIAQGPLSEGDPEITEFLSALVHELWLVRYPVREKISEANAALDEADMYCKKIGNALDRPENLDIRCLQQTLGTFKLFHIAIEHLTQCIHALPQKVHVV